MPIRDAAERPLSAQPGALPQMGDVVASFFQPLVFDLIQKSLVQGLLQEIAPRKVRTMGSREPWSARAVAIKPEGQRTWRWETLRCLPDVIMRPDDRVVFDGNIYRVMQIYDWKEYGYLQYDIAQDYTSR